MPNWNEILNEVQGLSASFDIVRKRYAKALFDLTGRNTIFYYSGWLAKPDARFTDITDLDMEGFMNSVNGLDCSLGLDLVLHTPGGDITATEAIVKYLRSKFDINIRIIVPQLAMSAGTMIACAGAEIIMGRQSSLGPIDPQLYGIPAFNILREYEDAKKDLLEHPENANYWSIRMQSLKPAIIQFCFNAVSLSSELTKNWLKTGMFANKPLDNGFVDGIVDNWLNENMESKIHGRHFSKDQCHDIGLTIIDLESNQALQDAVLSAHHAYSITLANTPVVKIIENHNGAAWVRTI